MGWCSGTDIFDEVVGALLDEKLDKKEIIKSLIEALEDRDWDTQDESRYIDIPIVQQAFIELDPDWKEYFDEIYPKEK